MRRCELGLWLALVLTLAGCAGPSRPDAQDITTSATFGAIPLFNAEQKPMLPPPGATIAGSEVAPATITEELNVLAISGGGSDGAFGAGVLKGWSESGRRPHFNIVTGVSTGALIATFAFLGPDWDDELARFYTHVTNEQIYVQKGLLGVFEESLYDTAPFRKMIEKVVTVKLLDAVAAEHARGRRLYVATTDLDSGTVVVWDMGGIAASDHRDRLETYRDVLVASAAFPAFFQPVYVMHTDRGRPRMHVDGGVKAPVLLRSFMVDGPQKKKTVYMLINGKLTLKTAGNEPVPASVVAISRRSIAELMRGLTYKTIYQAYVTTRRAKSSFRILHVPDAATNIEDPLRFRPKEMRALYDIGRDMGRKPDNWPAEPPRLEPLERLEEAVLPASRVKRKAAPASPAKAAAKAAALAE